MKWHRQLGAYGICIKDGRLLVIYKNGGPYKGRYDLPGGSIEPNESLNEAVHREFFEETGITVNILRNIGVRDYIVPWTRVGFDHTHSHHVAIYYEVEYCNGDVKDSPKIDDSNGATWLDIDKISFDNASPLVLEAFDWIKSKELPLNEIRYDKWILKS